VTRREKGLEHLKQKSPVTILEVVITQVIDRKSDVYMKRSSIWWDHWPLGLPSLARLAIKTWRHGGSH